MYATLFGGQTHFISCRVMFSVSCCRDIWAEPAAADANNEFRLCSLFADVVVIVHVMSRKYRQVGNFRTGSHIYTKVVQGSISLNCSIYKFFFSIYLPYIGVSFQLPYDHLQSMSCENTALNQSDSGIVFQSMVLNRYPPCYTPEMHRTGAIGRLIQSMAIENKV